MLPKPQKSLVVYTALIGQYEELRDQPIAVESSIPFICFTDRDDLTSKTWNIIKIKTLGLDATREARRIKILPHVFLNDFESSIWIDNTATLKSAPEFILDSFIPKNGPSLGLCRHPWRSCIYDEAEALIMLGIDDERRIREQMDVYKRQGYPRAAGLTQTTVIARRHWSDDVRAHAEHWLAHVLRFSRRDQLSFNPTAAKSDLEFKVVDIDTSDNKFFHWPTQINRLPYGFDPEVYKWLNPEVKDSHLDATSHYNQIGRAKDLSFFYPPMNYFDQLANKNKSNKGSLYFDRNSYSRAYNQYLWEFRETISSVFVFGEKSSLKTIQDYLPHCDVFLFDDTIKPPFNKQSKETEDPQFYHEVASRKISELRYPLRVIVDDGLAPPQVRHKRVFALLQLLDAGGVYCLENLHKTPAGSSASHRAQLVEALQALGSGSRRLASWLQRSGTLKLSQSVNWVRFHDSLDPGAPNAGRDALCVLRRAGNRA
jgi:hypothetical protein